MAKESTSLKQNLLVSAAALVVALVLAEIVVRIVDPVRPPDRVEFQVDTEAYWRVVPNQHDPRPPAVTVNTQGFRDTEDVGAKDPSKTRIFVLGDSYTWASGVADEDTYAAQLEAIGGGRLDVINGGTPGWGAFQFQVRLERWIDRLEPDIVLVLINTADVLRQPYASEEAEQEFLRQSRLRNLVRQVSKLVTVTYRLYDRIQLQRQNRQVANAVAMAPSGAVPPERYARLLEQDTTRLAEMAALSAERGARFVLVAWPQRLPMTPAFLDGLESVAARESMIYVDLSDVLAKYSPEDYELPNDHHPNPFGQRLIAEAVFARLEKEL